MTTGGECFRWSAQINDLIGGWVVTSYPAPLAKHDHRADGDSTKCGYVIANCMTEQDACTIAELLNEVDYEPTLTSALASRYANTLRPDTTSQQQPNNERMATTNG